MRESHLEPFATVVFGNTTSLRTTQLKTCTPKEFTIKSVQSLFLLFYFLVFGFVLAPWLHSAHLPRCHFSKVPHLGVVVPFDRNQRSPCRKGDGWVETWLVAPQARRQRQIASFVVLVCCNIADAVLWPLPAEEFHLMTSVVSEKPDIFASRRVAMATCVNQRVRTSRVLGLNGVHAFTIWAVRARAGARGAWGRGVERPVVIPSHWVARQRECRRDVVLACVSL